MSFLHYRCDVVRQWILVRPEDDKLLCCVLLQVFFFYHFAAGVLKNLLSSLIFHFLMHLVTSSFWKHPLLLWASGAASFLALSPPCTGSSFLLPSWSSQPVNSGVHEEALSRLDHPDLFSSNVIGKMGTPGFLSPASLPSLSGVIYLIAST